MSVAESAKKVYEEDLQSRLEQEHKDDFVAIESSSRSFFLGKTFLEVALAAKKKFPDRKSFVIRIGHEAVTGIRCQRPSSPARRARGAMNSRKSTCPPGQVQRLVQRPSRSTAVANERQTRYPGQNHRWLLPRCHSVVRPTAAPRSNQFRVRPRCCLQQD